MYYNDLRVKRLIVEVSLEVNLVSNMDECDTYIITLLLIYLEYIFYACATHCVSIRSDMRKI